MKLSHYSFFGGAKTYREQIDQARRFGCLGVEPLANLDLADLDIEAAKRIREYIEKTGMQVPCFSVFMQTQTNQEAGIARVKKATDVAKVLGSPYIHQTVGEYAYERQSFSEYLKNAVSFINETSAYAEQSGMQLLVEPQGGAMNGIRHLSALFGAVKPPIGALFDTGNILRSGDTPEAYIKVFAPLIRHVHIKDLLIRKKPPIFHDSPWRKFPENKRAFRQTAVGMGDLDFIRILKMIKGIGYCGWYSFEYEAPETFEIYYPRSIKNFTTMYEAVFGAEGK